MGNCSHTPDRYRNQVSFFCTNAIYQPSHKQKADRVSNHESTVYKSVLFLIPSDLILQMRCQYTQCRSVNIQDSSGNEKKTEYDPAETGLSFFCHRIISVRLIHL